MHCEVTRLGTRQQCGSYIQKELKAQVHHRQQRNAAILEQVSEVGGNTGDTKFVLRYGDKWQTHGLTSARAD